MRPHRLRAFKTLIATAEAMTALALSPRLGVRFDGGTDHDAGNITVDATQVNFPRPVACEGAVRRHRAAARG